MRNQELNRKLLYIFVCYADNNDLLVQGFDFFFFQRIVVFFSRVPPRKKMLICIETRVEIIQ